MQCKVCFDPTNSQCSNTTALDPVLFFICILKICTDHCEFMRCIELHIVSVFAAKLPMDFTMTNNRTILTYCNIG